MKTYCVCKECGNQTFYAIEPVKCADYCKDCGTKSTRERNKLENEELKNVASSNPK